MNECEICGHVLGRHNGRNGICADCPAARAHHAYKFGRVRKLDVLAVALAFGGGLTGVLLLLWVLAALLSWPYVGRVPAPWEW